MPESSALKPVVVRFNDTRSIWLLRDHLTPLLSPEHTGGALALAITECHPGDGPPPHVHRREDEGFFILEGEMTFLRDDRQWRAMPGAFVWGPRDVVHAFRNSGNQPAKMVLFVAPTDFLSFAMTLAEPSVGFNQPPDLTPAKIGRLKQVAPTYGIEMRPDHPMPTSIEPVPAHTRRLWALGEDVTYLATSEQTGGRFLFVDIRTAPGGGPPPHVHVEQDEVFHVLAGTHDVMLGDTIHRVSPGDTVFIPRGTRHRYTNIGTEFGRLLSIHTPGGFEKFFDEVGVPYESAAIAPKGPPLGEEQLIALLSRHGMTM